MDFSKLPRLSNTEAATPQPSDPTSNAPQPDPPPFVRASSWCPNCGAPLMSGSRFCNSCGVQLGEARIRGTGEGGTVFDAIVSIVAGLFIFIISRSPVFFKWALSKIGLMSFDDSGYQKSHFDPLANQWNATSVPYVQSDVFLMDMGPALFALVLVMNGLVLLLLRKKLPVTVMFVLTLLVTLFNLVYVVMTYASMGIAMISLIAVLIGGMILFYQWQLIQALRERIAPPAVQGR